MPAPVVAFSVEVTSRCDHAGRDIVPAEVPAMTRASEKSQKIPKSAAEIDDRSVLIGLDKAEKLPVANLLNSAPFQSTPRDVVPCASSLAA